MPVQRGFIEDNQVIQTLAPHGPDHTFHVRSLPRRARCRQYRFDTHISYLLIETMAEDLVPIPQQIARRCVPWERFPKLLGSPFGGRVGRHTEVQDAAAVVSQYQEQVENLEADRWHRKKSTETMVLMWFSKKVRQVCEGGFRLRNIYLATLVS